MARFMAIVDTSQVTVGCITLVLEASMSRGLRNRQPSVSCSIRLRFY